MWSVGGGSAVPDAQGNAVLNVKGRAVSITRVKYVCDLSGKRLYKIRNRWLNLFVRKAYIYDASGKKIATVKDKFVNVRQEFFVTGYRDDIQVRGGFVGRFSQIMRNGAVIGSINRQVTVVNDAFELEAAAEDIPFLTALIIALDNITDMRKKK